MPVVCIWDVGMRVGDGFVSVPMAVAARGHGVMKTMVGVIVVTVVVSVRVFVLKFFVGVCVGMAFHKMQQNTQQHEQPGCDQEPRA